VVNEVNQPPEGTRALRHVGPSTGFGHTSLTESPKTGTSSRGGDARASTLRRANRTSSRGFMAGTRRTGRSRWTTGNVASSRLARRGRGMGESR